MKFVHTVFALLFSLVLVSTQTVVLAHADTAVSEECACCACQQTSCCVAAPNPTPVQPISSQTARTTTQNEAQLVTAVATLLVRIAPNPVRNFVPSVSFLSAPAEVPLFVRNCSFLI